MGRLTKENIDVTPFGTTDNNAVERILDYYYVEVGDAISEYKLENKQDKAENYKQYLDKTNDPNVFKQLKFGELNANRQKPQEKANIINKTQAHVQQKASPVTPNTQQLIIAGIYGKNGSKAPPAAPPSAASSDVALLAGGAVKKGKKAYKNRKSY